jgi:hypothetical protein
MENNGFSMDFILLRDAPLENRKNCEKTNPFTC